MKVSSFLDIAGPSTQVACYWFTDYQVKVNQSRTQSHVWKTRRLAVTDTAHLITRHCTVSY